MLNLLHIHKTSLATKNVADDGGVDGDHHNNININMYHHNKIKIYYILLLIIINIILLLYIILLLIPLIYIFM